MIRRICKRLAKFWIVWWDSAVLQWFSYQGGSTSATSIPAVMDGVCQGCAKRFPYPKGWRLAISLGSARVAESYQRSSRDPSPWWSGQNHGLGAPELLFQFSLPGYVQGQRQAVPTKAHSRYRVGAVLAQRRSRGLWKSGQETGGFAQGVQVSSVQEKNGTFFFLKKRKTRNCSSQSCEKPWQNI